MTFLLQAMSKKFQLVPPALTKPQRVGESYFTQGLFFDVFLPEAQYLGYSQRRKIIKKWLFRTTVIGCPVFIVALGFGMHRGYQLNKNNLQAIDQYVASYDLYSDKIKKGDPKLVATLPALEQLRQAKKLYTQPSGSGLNFIFISGYIRHKVSSAEQRALHSIFLPRVAAELEHTLKGNVADQNILYADLKGYLSFSAADYASKFSLRAPMEYRWNQQFASSPETAAALKYFLNIALQQRVEKLDVDNILISRIRGQLSEVNSADRAYGLLSLRANVGDGRDIYLSAESGNAFYQVFSESDRANAIPYLYSKRAFHNVFDAQYESIAEEVAQDNRDIGLSSANDTSSNEDGLEQSLEKTYNERYVKQWQQAINNIKIRPFTSLNEAVNVLDLLTSSNSPLSRLLTTVYDNTSGIDSDDVDVEDHFKAINSYTVNAGWGTSWHDTEQVLTKLHDYLVKLQQAPDQNKASFMVAKAVIEGKAKNPMKQLTDIANKAPKPVKTWLMALANNCWQIIIRGAHNEMNTAWNNKILPSYNSGMRNRFPLNPKAYSSVTMQSFNHLLGYQGALQQYFKNYIAPFINTEGEQWQPIAQNGLTIELPQSHIDAFQRARVIRQEYFPSGSKQAKLNMTIKPLTLDKRATNIEFLIGSNKINYSHGPQNDTSITWPLPFDSQDSRIVITTFNVDQYAHSASGGWSLFRMFHYGTFKPGADDGTYIFNIDFRGHTASFQVTGPSDINVFTLRHIAGFNLPETIAPNPIVHPAKVRRKR